MAVTYGGATYYYATNIQGDVVAILNASGTAVVTYTYDAWGNILTTTGTLSSTLGTHNPLRYRGYVYDQETGLYYLQSRYYNPEMGRFICADSLVSTGQGILGNNMFAYCLNNPVNYSDPFGNVGSSNHFYVTIESGKKLLVMYDVPLYSQGAYSLCWAFCQIMVEDYHAGFTSTPKEAEQKAIALAKSVNGEKNIWGQEKWNRGAFPPNCGKGCYPDTIVDVYQMLQSGPVYGYYSALPGQSNAHLVVITGVDVSEGLIYINNPWGMSGSQTFAQFLYGFYGNNSATLFMPLRYVYPVIQEEKPQ